LSRLASRGPGSAPLTMEGLRHAVGAELRAETARPVLRPIDEDTAAGRACADPKALPAVVADCLEQRHRRHRGDPVRQPPDPLDPPLLSGPLELGPRGALAKNTVELFHRCFLVTCSERRTQGIAQGANLGHIPGARAQSLAVASPAQKALEE